MIIPWKYFHNRKEDSFAMQIIIYASRQSNFSNKQVNETLQKSITPSNGLESLATTVHLIIPPKKKKINTRTIKTEIIQK